MNVLARHPLRRPGRIRPATVILFAAVLLLAGTGGCSKTPEEIKAAQAKLEAETTGRLFVKSNRPNTTIEAALVPAAGQPAPPARKGSADGAAEQTLSVLTPGTYRLTAQAEAGLKSCKR